MKRHMKQIFSIIVLAQVLLFWGSCFHEEEGHMSFALVNKSNQTIACQEFEFYKSQEDDTLFKDMLCANMNIRPDSLVRYKSYDVSWEVNMGDLAYVQLLILDNDSLVKYYKSPIDTIHKKVPVLHIYQMKQADLEKMNWTVIYPPLGDLKNNKISPDYRKVRK